MIVVVVGLCTTLALAAAAWQAHGDNEQRLLEQRVREATAVLEATVPSVVGPLATSAAVADLSEVDPETVRTILASQVGADARYVSASVWPVDATAPTVVVGERPELGRWPVAEIRSFFDRAVPSDGLVVLDLLDAPTPRLGYAFTAPGKQVTSLVYAEQVLPGERTSVPQADSAFAGLDYAIYLGPEAAGRLLAASTASLPFEGRRASATVALGDADLQLVMSPRGELGGQLLASLPVVALVTGLVATVAAAVLTEQTQRRRVTAEALARENARLYDEQRQGSLTLQHSLLPQSLPQLPGLELAVRYAAGEAGTDVGGDWYEVTAVGDGLSVVVGDVSGRGLVAAGVMASVRYTMRTLAAQGLAPGDILATTNSVVDDGGPIRFFATAVCGRIDVGERTVAFADAGHPPPLLITEDGATWVDVPVGPPLGVRYERPYQERTIPLPPDATIVMVTDGLYERRGEPIDTGLERLRSVAAGCRGDLDTIVDTLMTELTGGAASDDTAILALRLTT